MVRPASLTLAVPKSTSPVSSNITSPTDVGSSTPSPRDAAAGSKKGVEAPVSHHDVDGEEAYSPDFTSLPPFPSSPKDVPKHAREPSKGFFSNLKASKSSNKVHHVEPTIRQVSEDTPRSNAEAGDNSVYSVRKSPGSTPDLNHSVSTEAKSAQDRSGMYPHASAEAYTESRKDQQGYKIPRRPIGTSVMSDSVVTITQHDPSQPRKPKPRLVGLLTRTRSTRVDDSGRRSKPATPISSNAAPEIRMQYDGPTEEGHAYASPKTAPLRQDFAYRDMVRSGIRNRSADRQTPSNHSQENIQPRRSEKGSTQGLSSSYSGGLREAAGGHLFTNIKNTSSKAADGLGKAGKSIFGKVARSGSTNAKEEERYVLSVINLPLVEQTRRTRIAKRLEKSRDKTEFWMPALPWRCIDFLNFRGCEEEGLYRIPGSDLQIRQWQKRFDQEGDIDLFEQEELFDINIVGSMFKAWLRDLPTEILPKGVQMRVAQECAGAKECPQLLKDELSSLQPWNYYLLFAITCHLSLLIAYSDKNKMNYHNLCVCFQPCLRIDNFCFQFLVNDWRNCWQGCWTEKEALNAEMAVLEGRTPPGDSPGNGENNSLHSTAVEDKPPSESASGMTLGPEERSLASSGTAEGRSLASSESQKASLVGRGQQSRPPPLMFTKASEEQLSTVYSESSTTPTATVTIMGDSGNVEDRAVEDEFASIRTPLPELAPVQPLSPIEHHFS